MLQNQGFITDLMNTFEKIYQAVNKIPFGMVSTYGRISDIVGLTNPRLVGYALSNLPTDTNVPWHRIVNKHGKISRRDGEGPDLQKLLLESEGIVFSFNDRIDLETYLW